MNIVHLVNEGLFGGVLRVVLAESHYMNMLGYNSFVIQLFSVRIPEDVLQKYRRANLLCLTRNSLPSYFQDYLNPVFREILGKFLRKVKLNKNVDYIIMHNLTALPLARYLKRITSAKLILYVHNITGPPGLKKLLSPRRISAAYRDNISHVDLVITSSTKMAKLVREIFDVDAYVIPPGCEPATIIHLTKLKYVLVPQRLSLGKQIPNIAKLLSLCKSSFCIVFAGSSHYTTTMVLKLLKRYTSKPYMVLVNPNDNALTWLYRNASCSVSIVHEPFGMYILEAASQGTPVVAPKDAGASELFAHGVHGYFFEHESEVPEYVDKLVTDPELVAKMGYEAWRVCREKYTWSNHVMKLNDVLRKL